MSITYQKSISKLSIQSNAHALARYSALVQEISGSIVEPEVLMDGEHSASVLTKTSEVIKNVLRN